MSGGGPKLFKINQLDGAESVVSDRSDDEASLNDISTDSSGSEWCHSEISNCSSASQEEESPPLTTPRANHPPHSSIESNPPPNRREIFLPPSPRENHLSPSLHEKRPPTMPRENSPPPIPRENQNIQTITNVSRKPLPPPCPSSPMPPPWYEEHFDQDDLGD